MFFQNEQTLFIILSIFLWTIFGSFNLHLSTKMLQNMRSNSYFVHAFGFLCTLFLFHSSNAPLSSLIFHSIIIYFSYLFLIKCRWYFMGIGILLLISHDIIRRRVHALRVNSETENRAEKDLKDEEKHVPLYENMMKLINVLFFVVIIVGIVDLSRIKKRSKGKNFSWVKLLFGVREKFIFKEIK